MTQPRLFLEPFSAENAPLVLEWRNSKSVRMNALNDQVISAQDHAGFLAKIAENPNSNYYVLHIDGAPKAVLNVDVSNGVARWGMYLSPQDTPQPGLFPLVILLALHLAFDVAKARALESDVLPHNTAPQRMNAFLGIPKTSGDGAAVLAYRLDAQDLEPVRSKAKSLLTRDQKALLDQFLP